VQALKTLFLYTQTDRESINEYTCNFKSLWDMVEALGGLPGIHKGLVTGLLALPGQVRDPSNITGDERTEAKEEVVDAIKAALLISGADKRRYGRLKEQLANNYLLGTDQYPDTLEKASRILGNYQVAKGSPFGDQRNTNKKGGLAFIQQGARAGRGRGGQGPQTAGRQAGAGDTTAAREDAASVGRSTLPSERMQRNNAGDSHCYHCGGENHWANECPELAEEQQAQLHMTLEGREEDELGAQTAHQFFHTSMVQGEELPDCQAYLNGCSTVTVFKSKKHLSNIRTVARGIKINCNAGNLKTNPQGDYGTMSV
jgi:hypothetical protein